VKNCFTDSLLYREVNEVAKEPLPDDIDSGGEVDSKSEEDAPATFALEPIVAYQNDPECNNHADDNGEWVINENVAFNYSLCLDDVFNSADISSLHMPLPILNMACMHVEDNK